MEAEDSNLANHWRLSDEDNVDIVDDDPQADTLFIISAIIESYCPLCPAIADRSFALQQCDCDSGLGKLAEAASVVAKEEEEATT